MSRRQPDSLVSQVVAFFEANPDEELTYADVVAKFGCTPRNAYSRLVEAQKAGAPIEVVKVIRLKPLARTRVLPVEGVKS